jgi:predicted ABC-type ATPase
MIAGPNGAGKTTMTLELISNLPMFYEFINADEIAKALAPLHPETVALTASKLMIKRIKELLHANKNFTFETTAAGVNYIKHLKAAQLQGYEITLTFLRLSSPDEAVKRVAERVKQGGHNVPKEIIIKRYYTGLKNLFKHYFPLSDNVSIMDNSSERTPERLIAKKSVDGSIDIYNKVIWEKLQRAANE